MPTNHHNSSQTLLQRYYGLFLSGSAVDEAVITAQRQLPRVLSRVTADNDQLIDFIRSHPRVNQALLLAMRYGQQLLDSVPLPLCQASDSQIIQRFARERLASAQQEQVCVMAVTAQLLVIAWDVIAIGTLTQVTMVVRDIAQRLLQHNVDRFILVHNHPSGQVSPSKADIGAITSLAEVLEPIGLAIFDVVIVSPGKSFSFQENKLFYHKRLT